MVKSPAEIYHGPMLIGGALTILLFGISIAQTHIYWNAYKDKDRWIIKYFVLLLLVADALHCVFILVYLYDALIKHFDDATFLVTSNWVYSTEPALSGMISSMVQTFFGWRVKLLTESWILLVIIQFCSTAVFLMGIADAIACYIVKTFTHFHKFKPVVIIWLVCAALADMIITVTLVIFLRKHKTGFKHTDSRIDRIIRFTIQTGLITVVCAMTDLLLYLLYPTGVHLVFNCVLPKLYTNSLLSSLNSRRGWQFNESQMKFSQDLRFFGDLSENGVQLSVLRPEILESQVADHLADENKS